MRRKGRRLPSNVSKCLQRCRSKKKKKNAYESPVLCINDFVHPLARAASYIAVPTSLTRTLILFLYGLGDASGVASGDGTSTIVECLGIASVSVRATS